MRQLKLIYTIIPLVICSTFKVNAQQELLDFSNIKDKNLSELRIARNEIFAKYGYIFKSKELNEYFQQKDWYEPKFSNVDVLLTEIDKKNITLILNREKEIRSFESKFDISIEKPDMYKYELLNIKKIDQNYFYELIIYERHINEYRNTVNYYQQGQYLLLSNSLNENISKSEIDFNLINNIAKSVSRLKSSNHNKISEIQKHKINLFSANGITLQVIKPSDGPGNINYFFELINGELRFKFQGDSWQDQKLEFKKMNDSLFFSYTYGRDEIVDNIQFDYLYTYNKNTNSLKYIKPEKQKINWLSTVNEELNVYETIEDAKNENNTNVKYILKSGDKVILDTLYRNKNVLLFFKYNSDIKGYLNTKQIKKKLSGNLAG